MQFHENANKRSSNDRRLENKDNATQHGTERTTLSYSDYNISLSYIVIKSWKESSIKFHDVVQKFGNTYGVKLLVQWKLWKIISNLWEPLEFVEKAYAHQKCSRYCGRRIKYFASDVVACPWYDVIFLPEDDWTRRAKQGRRQFTVVPSLDIFLIAERWNASPTARICITSKFSQEVFRKLGDPGQHWSIPIEWLKSGNPRRTQSLESGYNKQ